MRAVAIPALGQQLVIMSDAHFGAAPAATEDGLFAFLQVAPTLGDSLLINGDLFDFWFAYRQVVPRRGFRLASALARLAERMPVAMTGGNHDRWGDSFWDGDLGIRFGAESLRFRVGARTGLALHGDGLAEQHAAARLMHRLTRSRAGLALFRAIPPDLSFRMVDRLSGHLADATRDPEVLRRAADAQAIWAEARLAAEPDLGLVVLGHTHRAACTEPFPGRQYCNPGAWMEGQRYAVVTETTVELRAFATG